MKKEKPSTIQYRSPPNLDPRLKPLDTLLMQWGRLTRGGVNLGIPKKWVTENVRSGKFCAPAEALPPEVAIADRLLALLLPEHREVIEMHYQVSPAKSLKAKCNRLGLTEGAYSRLLREAREMVWFALRTLLSLDLRNPAPLINDIVSLV